MNGNSETPVIGPEFQRFEFVDDKSSKFWEVRISGASVDVRFGRMGTAGQSQTKTFEEAAEAQKHAHKFIA